MTVQYLVLCQPLWPYVSHCHDIHCCEAFLFQQESAASKPGMCNWGSFSYCAEPVGMGDEGRVWVGERVALLTASSDYKHCGLKCVFDGACVDTRW